MNGTMNNMRGRGNNFGSRSSLFGNSGAQWPTMKSLYFPIRLRRCAVSRGAPAVVRAGRGGGFGGGGGGNKNSAVRPRTRTSPRRLISRYKPPSLI